MTNPYIPVQRGGAPPAVDWRGYAACRQVDPMLFFPVGTGREALIQVERAKQVCASCPVRAACLDSALAAGHELGVWGGTAAGERRALRAARPRAFHPLSPSGQGHSEPGEFDS